MASRGHSETRSIRDDEGRDVGEPEDVGRGRPGGRRLHLHGGRGRQDARPLERPTDSAGASSVGELLEIRGDQFALKGTHGYQITVVGYLAGRHTVTLYAKRPHAEVEYTAPGKVTEEGVSARFGSLGSVDVHFEASGRVREAIDYCDSSHPTVAVRLGTFVGTIDFRGERDYTSVSADRARGGVGNDAALPGEPEDASCRSLAAGGEVVQNAQ